MFDERTDGQYNGSGIISPNLGHMRDSDFGGPLHESIGDGAFVDVVGPFDATIVVRWEGHQRDADHVGALTQMNRHAVVQGGVEERTRTHERRHVSSHVCDIGDEGNNNKCTIDAFSLLQTQFAYYRLIISIVSSDARTIYFTLRIPVTLPVTLNIHSW